MFSNTTVLPSRISGGVLIIIYIPPPHIPVKYFILKKTLDMGGGPFKNAEGGV